MPKFKVYISVMIDDIEASNEDEAWELARVDYIWEDYLKDFDVEEIDDDDA